jgi:hypothetical protein
VFEEGWEEEILRGWSETESGEMEDYWWGWNKLCYLVAWELEKRVSLILDTYTRVRRFNE